MVCITSVDGIKPLVIDLIGQLSRDDIGRLLVKPWCYWLSRLVMSLVRFDPSIVTVKRSFIVSQIVSFPVDLTVISTVTNSENEP